MGTNPSARRLEARGVAAAAAALGGQWLLHIVYPRAPFAPFSLGERLIRLVPGGIATRAIDTLGHEALQLFSAGIVVGVLIFGLALRRLPAWTLAAIAAGATLLAGAVDPRHVSIPGTLVAAAVAAAGAALAAAAFAPAGDVDPGRRRVLAGIGAAGIGAVLAGGAALRTAFAQQARAVAVRIDRRARVTADQSFEPVAGLTPRITSRAKHYTVDIDLDDPAPDPTAWRLRVHGLVEREKQWSLDDLRAMPTIEQVFTLSCISNVVGGDLVSTARWTGVPLHSLLDLAKPQGTARFVMARAADGYSESYPLSFVMRDDMHVAFGMNGMLLPRAHGFPARLIVPGRYGMRNVKWITELELVASDELGYWEQRGWDLQAIMRTQSRFDTPKDGGSVAPSFVAAGLAWAGDRGVSRVEVSADDGETWTPAILEQELAPLAWRRWQLRVTVPRGQRFLQVRATDGTGKTQDSERQPPHPSGSTGYHRLVVNAR